LSDDDGEENKLVVLDNHEDMDEDGDEDPNVLLDTTTSLACVWNDSIMLWL